jgi:Zn-dependent protease
MPTDLVFWVLVLMFSVILHEVAHGYMANFLGDPTAKLQGRLTLNPLSHIDPLGTVILPTLLLMSGSSILIGYAKPVPYNPYNLRGKYGEALVAAAGPGTNILLALVFGLSIRFFGQAIDPDLVNAFVVITSINIFLAIFNLIPIPPLDGSKVLSILLPGALGRGYESIRMSFERLGVLGGTLLILCIFYFLSPVFADVVGAVFTAITGFSR